MDDGGEDVTGDVKLLGYPNLLAAFVDNGVLMRMSIGLGGADGSLEEIRIEADVIDRCRDRSGGAGDDGSRNTRVREGVGDLDVDKRFVFLVTVRIWERCEEREVVVKEL